MDTSLQPNQPECAQIGSLPSDRKPTPPAFTHVTQMSPTIAGVFRSGYAPVLIFNILLLGVLLCHALPHSTCVVTDNLAECLGPLIASIWCLRGRWGGATRGIARWAPMFLGLGVLGYAIGQGIWSYYEIVLHRATPFPSWSDVGFLSAYPFLLLGILTLPTCQMPPCRPAACLLRRPDGHARIGDFQLVLRARPDNDTRRRDRPCQGHRHGISAGRRGPSFQRLDPRLPRRGERPPAL